MLTNPPVPYDFYVGVPISRLLIVESMPVQHSVLKVSGEGPSRGFLRDCTTSLINRLHHYSSPSSPERRREVAEDCGKWGHGSLGRTRSAPGPRGRTIVTIRGIVHTQYSSTNASWAKQTANILFWIASLFYRRRAFDNILPTVVDRHHL